MGGIAPLPCSLEALCPWQGHPAACRSLRVSTNLPAVFWPPCPFLKPLFSSQPPQVPDQPLGEQARDVFAGVFCCIVLVLLQLKQRGQGKYLISSTKAWLQESA